MLVEAQPPQTVVQRRETIRFRVGGFITGWMVGGLLLSIEGVK